LTWLASSLDLAGSLDCQQDRLPTGWLAHLTARVPACSQDQEVKEASITGTATAVAQLADLLAPEVRSVPGPCVHAQLQGHAPLHCTAASYRYITLLHGHCTAARPCTAAVLVG